MNLIFISSRLWRYLNIYFLKPFDAINDTLTSYLLYKDEAWQNDYIEIFEYVNKNILEIKNIKYNEKKDPIKDYLIYLLKYNPSFIILNKNLLDLEKSFIELCKKENLDISYITEDYLQVDRKQLQYLFLQRFPTTFLQTYSNVARQELSNLNRMPQLHT